MLVPRISTPGTRENLELLNLVVTNQSAYNVDFSLLFVDSGYGITPLYPPADFVVDNRLEPSQSKTIGPMTIEGDSLGLEHLVVIATRALGQPIDFSWLAQDSLQRQSTTRSSQQAAQDTPFGQLFQQALFATGTTRGVPSFDLNSVTFRVVSWRTVRGDAKNGERRP